MQDSNLCAMCAVAAFKRNPDLLNSSCSRVACGGPRSADAATQLRGTVPVGLYDATQTIAH